jgi:hypothetical protein
MTAAYLNKVSHSLALLLQKASFASLPVERCVAVDLGLSNSTLIS